MELIAFLLGLALVSTFIAAGVFWLLWRALGRRLPLLVGFVCLVIGMGLLGVAASSNWLGFGELGLGILVLAAVAGPAILGMVFMVKGTRESLRRSGPGIRDAITVIRQDWFDKR